MNDEETILEHFSNPNQVVDDIYGNGGVVVGSWGFLSGGYGGGIEQEQALRLIYINGYLNGMPQETRHPLMKSLNRLLQARHPDVVETELPFINLE